MPGQEIRDRGVTSRVRFLRRRLGPERMRAAWHGEGEPFPLEELEPFVGGTSSWGQTGVVPHPWGAHYLPAPEPGEN